ncbi:MAG: xanthine dehydrogenase family protein molybdopterin-binding subunit [Nitriliruptoraceae bacterium]
MTTNRKPVVGTRPIRPDGVDKVTGRAQFGADVHWPGMLVGKVLRSPHPHARIISIDTSAAKALAGVHDVITGADLPDIASIPEFNASGIVNLRHLASNVLARDKVLYHGHPVAAVAADTAAIAAKALDLIDVTYEPIDHVLDAVEAMAPDAPILHDDLRTQGVFPVEDRPTNVASRKLTECGDADAAMAEADVVVSGTFSTQAVHQAYIEPHAVAAKVGEDGLATVWVSTQGYFMVRDVSAAILGMSSGDIRVLPAEIGGGFGGKTTVYAEPLAIALAKRTGRPVKFVMRREEVFRATGPAPASHIEASIGATRDGQIVAAKGRLVFEAGAFPGSPVGVAAMSMYLCYDIPNVYVEGFDVVVNKPKVTAYRAPGAPISFFASESLVDDLARELGMDPLELRLRNAVEEGDTTAGGAAFEAIGLKETLEAAKDSDHYHSAKPDSGTPGIRTGRGVASGFWRNGGLQSTVAINIGSDGQALLVSGSPDIGGSRASLAMMAADELGVDMSRVHPVLGDTQTIGYNDNTGGSRVTYATGMATVGAARDLIQQFRERAASMWEIDVDEVEWRDGAAVATDGSDREVSLEDLAYNARATGGPFSASHSVLATGQGPGFATHVCDVEVDEELGSVKILRYLAIQDAGRAIHPSYVEGQMQGAVAQGVGWALNEEFIWREDGILDNASFLDYRIPVASDLPMIDTHIVEVPNPHHPYGVRGVGEAGIVPPLAAVANAILDATGIRAHDLPISPPRLRSLIERRDT